MQLQARKCSQSFPCLGLSTNSENFDKKFSCGTKFERISFKLKYCYNI